VQQVQWVCIRRTASAAIVALLMGAAHVRAQDAAAAPPAVPSPKEVVDELGRSVRVPQPVRRIVSLAPSLTETIYALGLQDRLMGDTDYCDYPPDAQKKPKVGGAINPSLEEIAALHPDLVLVTPLNRYDTLHALEALGIPTYATDPHTVDEIISSTQRLADVLGAAEAGKGVAEDLEHRLAALQERLSAIPPRRVLFIVWTDPLISIGKDTFISDALRRAGAVSIVDSAQSWPHMNLEEVVRLQPEYLVFAASHSEAAARDFDELASRPAWRILEAVRHRRFAVISDAVNRPAPRIVSAIEDLARQLHPEAFVEKPHAGKEKIEKNSFPAAPPRAYSYHFAGPGNFAQGECACAL
jgi:iron complex transport system substrate-binding protein